VTVPSGAKADEAAAKRGMRNHGCESRNPIERAKKRGKL
jgi:hypothetical protein